MRFEPSCGYEKIDRIAIRSGTASAWVSMSFEDACWDAFLQQSSLGQFQQSTIWARAKEPGGWKPLRVVLTIDDEMVGGFQILQRLQWWGRIGYVSKGPVVASQEPEIADYAVALLRKVSRQEGLLALVAQPPDCCKQMASRLTDGGFRLRAPVDVYRATLIFDLRDGFEAVELRMARQTRRKIRQAMGRGVSIREGGRQDLEVFFDLMLATCRRQGVHPSPPHVRDLLALWDAARPLGCIRLVFAEHAGKPLSGIMCIAFGKTFTMWKRGWNGMEGERRPNELVTSEALRLAAQNGYDFCDYSEFDEKMALAIHNGQALSPAQGRSRHSFISHFGGSPRFLPEARMYLPHPWIESAVVFSHTWAGKVRRRLQI